jgi:hypothetical protein
MDTELATRMALRDSRIQFQQEMKRALSCTRKVQKIKLAAEWREKYSPYTYKELIACAKNKAVAVDIINWKIDEL